MESNTQTHDISANTSENIVENTLSEIVTNIVEEISNDIQQQNIISEIVTNVQIDLPSVISAVEDVVPDKVTIVETTGIDTNVIKNTSIHIINLPESDKSDKNDENDEHIEKQSSKSSGSHNSKRVFWKNADKMAKITVFAYLAGESYKVFMASLLSIFVPQQCDDDMCTLDQNLNNITEWNKVVVAWNFITLCYIAFIYLVENNRETWLINTFDNDDTVGDHALQETLKIYPIIRSKLIKWNDRLYKAYLIGTIIFVINTILSGILVFHNYYLDFRTVTVYLTNVILLSGKLKTGITRSLYCKKEGLAYSMYLTEPISWNVIDKDVKKE